MVMCGQAWLDPLKELDRKIKDAFRELFGFGSAEAAEALPLAEIEQAWQGLMSLLVDTLRNAVADLRNAWGGFASFVGSSVDGMIANINRLISRIEAAIEAMRRLNAERARGGGDAPGFARGGSVWGPGTSTSDSIFARLSRGEFVIRAAAVRKYGLALMHMLNRGLLPRDFLKQLRGFNMGGLVTGIEHSFGPMAVPALAAGGLPDLNGRGAGRPVNIHLPGGQTVEAVMQEPAIDQLQRISITEQTTRAGRRQSSVR